MEGVIEDIQDRRDAFRVEVEFPAKLAKLKGRFSLTNLSSGGVFIKTEAPEAFAVGEEFRITIHETFLGQAISAKGIVLRITEERIAGRFSELSPLNEQLVKDWGNLHYQMLPLEEENSV